jgi:hypothetical protein
VEGRRTRYKRVVVGAVAFVMLSLMALPSAAEYSLEESVIYAEGIGMDGAEVVPDAAFPATIVGGASNVVLDWSDDIIFHQFPVGQKIRTEVVLHEVAADGSYVAAVYTITAHLQINALNEDGTLGETLYSSSIAQGVFADGKNDFYSAEVNELGNLLYGYNWETRGLSAGWYRLTFWLEIDETCPEVNPWTGVPVTYYPVDITHGAAGDTDPSAGAICGFVGYDLENDMSWLDMYLYAKKTGRR